MRRILLFLLIYPHLLFGDSSGLWDTNTDDMSLGSGATLDNIQTGGFCMWVNPNNSSAYASFISKYDDTVTGWIAERFPDPTQLQLTLRTSGSSSFVWGNTFTLNSSTWNFACGAWNYNAATLPTIHIGQQFKAVVDVSSGLSQTAGTGTFDNDSALSMIIGNALPSTNYAPTANFGSLVFWKGRRPNNDEMQEMMFVQRPGTTTVAIVQTGFEGTATNKDLTGNGNNGTPSGFSPSALGPPIIIDGGSF